MKPIFTNEAETTLAAPVDAAATAISIEATDADLFPVPQGGKEWFPLTIIAEDGSTEICHATARNIGTITVLRGREGTAARSFPAGTTVELRATAASLADLTIDRLAKAGNLEDLADKVAARKNLGTETETRLSPTTGRPQFFDPTRGADGEWRNFGTGGLEPIMKEGTVAPGQITIEFPTEPPAGSKILVFLGGAFQTSAAYNLNGRTLSFPGGLDVGVRYAIFAYIPAENRPVMAASVGATEIDWTQRDQILHNLGIAPRGVGEFFLFNGTKPPPYAIAYDGRTISRAMYPDHWAHVQTLPNYNPNSATRQWWQYGPGDGLNTYQAPDWINNPDGARIFATAIASGESVGSFLNDAMQRITGTIGVGVGNNTTYPLYGSASGAFVRNKRSGTNIFQSTPASSNDFTDSYSFDSSLVARTASHTRPKSVGFLPCEVVSTGLVTDPAHVNAVGTVNAVNQLVAELAALKAGVSGHVTNVSDVIIDLTPYLEGGWGNFELDIEAAKLSSAAYMALLASGDGGTSWYTAYSWQGHYMLQSSTDIALAKGTSNPRGFLGLTMTAGTPLVSNLKIQVTPAVFYAHVQFTMKDANGWAHGTHSITREAPVNALRLFGWGATTEVGLSECRYSLRKIARP